MEVLVSVEVDVSVDVDSRASELKGEPALNMKWYLVKPSD